GMLSARLPLFRHFCRLGDEAVAFYNFAQCLSFAARNIRCKHGSRHGRFLPARLMERAIYYGRLPPHFGGDEANKIGRPFQTSNAILAFCLPMASSAAGASKEWSPCGHTHFSNVLMTALPPGKPLTNDSVGSGACPHAIKNTASNKSSNANQMNSSPATTPTAMAIPTLILF